MPKRVHQLGANDEVALASDIPESGGGGGAPAIVTLDFASEEYQYLVVSGRQWGPFGGSSSPLYPLLGTTVAIPVDPANPSISGYFHGYADECVKILNGERIYELPSTLSPGDALFVRFASCLDPATPILMADGAARRLGDVRVGDMVASPFGPDRVAFVNAGTGNATDIWTFGDGSVVKTIGRHRFFNCDLGEPLYLEAWNIGERALRADGAKVALAGHERVPGEAVHATLVTEKWNLYYAGGLLAGNRKSRYQGLDAPPPGAGGRDDLSRRGLWNLLPANGGDDE